MRTSIFRRYERESALRGFPDVQFTCPPLPSRKGAGFRLACNTSTASSHGRTSTCRFNRARSSGNVSHRCFNRYPPSLQVDRPQRRWASTVHSLLFPRRITTPGTAQDSKGHQKRRFNLGAGSSIAE
ncbi:hypothetical protein B0H10DRAFT_922026 [Mycena sp. CBHHK59/15]|nr:hypothetical protein B0H10DRAFT_922026 [Mycena sp. CBHHK59/15]